MLLLGIDIGTSFIKVSVVDAETQQSVASGQYPENENSITSLQTGWAEQSPEMWWEHTVHAIEKLNATNKFNSENIAAIGISYQMHGLVIVDKQQKVLRDSIIWCDSRAVEIGGNAFAEIGEEICSTCLLNSPGNFTASKLSWVKKFEPEIYQQIDKIMLPGDFIAMKLTGEITTTSSALSEGIFWDFKKDKISEEVMNNFGFDDSLIPKVQEVFTSHGKVLPEVAQRLCIPENIPVTYKAGDQLNNALSLNVLEPGEVAANAGTSGVIYAVTDKLFSDKFSRVNSFVHVNHETGKKRIGVLLCINGAAIMYNWARKVYGENLSYKEMDQLAAKINPGSDGLFVFPFGNGAERMLQNKMVGAHIDNIDLNKHTKAHIFRAVQEGIAFAFRYGLDIMRENDLHPTIIRVGKANLFLSDVFIHSFVNATGVAVELYENDGSVGAALGAGIGAGIYKSYSDAYSNLKPLRRFEPTNIDLYDELYKEWKKLLEKKLV
ncbi:MAG: FGGY family carbohydrate kinase [Bacteroidota bacterium]|nr:FGGY family carbohydrate kinase [Bacteroidota bacterium]